MNQLFPVFLKLNNPLLHVLVVGGGNVGLEKLTALLTNSPGATITLVAPVILPAIETLTQQYKGLQLIVRKFEPYDLQDKDLVLAATDDKAENERIYHLARANHLLVNVADTPELCDFYLSSIVQKGNLKVAISTNGLSPTMAKRLKETLNEALPDDLETALHQLREIREMLKGDFTYKVQELNRITQNLIVDKNKSVQ
jgi:precorrin-2 dehydrogenase/sirohydrochlorin ferrochelatase